MYLEFKLHPLSSLKQPLKIYIVSPQTGFKTTKITLIISTLIQRWKLLIKQHLRLSNTGSLLKIRLDKYSYRINHTNKSPHSFKIINSSINIS